MNQRALALLVPHEVYFEVLLIAMEWKYAVEQQSMLEIIIRNLAGCTLQFFLRSDLMCIPNQIVMNMVSVV